MGVTKSENYTNEQNNFARLAKALGHPARIAIVDHLAQVDTCIGGDLVDQLPLAQPIVSQHLRELKTAGLIKGEIEGTAVCYCLDPSTLEILQQYLTNLVQHLKEKPKPTCYEK